MPTVPEDALTKQFPVQLMSMRKFRKHLFEFCQNVAGNQSQVPELFQRLKPLFGSLQKCQKQAPLHLDSNKKEMQIAFWAFTTNVRQHTTLISFLLKLLLPRLHVSAETKDSHLEAFFCLSPIFFFFTSQEFEFWFEQFLETLNMSAGVTPIDVYMGPQMLSCLDRIEHGNPLSLKHNLYTHKDFLTLYRLKLSARNEAADVALQTHGMEFSARNMISLYHQNTRLNRSLRDYNTRERQNREALQQYNDAVGGIMHSPHHRRQVDSTDRGTTTERTDQRTPSGNASSPVYYFGDRNVLERMRLAFMPHAMPFEPE